MNANNIGINTYVAKNICGKEHTHMSSVLLDRTAREAEGY